MKTTHPVVSTAEPLSQIRRAMLRKGITHRTLTKHFRVNDDAIARALSGRRNSLLRKIAHFVRTQPGKHVAVRPVRMDGMSEASRRSEGTPSAKPTAYEGCLRSRASATERLLTEDAFGRIMSEAEPPVVSEVEPPVNVHLISLE